MEGDMQNQVKMGLSFGVMVTVLLYVCGFLWQYSYLATITNHMGWIKVVSSDYLYLGSLALIFSIPQNVAPYLVVFFAFYFSGLTGSLLKYFWSILGSKRRVRLVSFVQRKNLPNLDFFNSLRIFLTIVFFTFLFLWLAVSIFAESKRQLAARLSSGPTDILCEKNNKCHKGKILYTSDKQYYFYTFDGSVDYKKGQLLVVGINDTQLKLGWYPRGKNAIDQIVEENTSG